MKLDSVQAPREPEKPARPAPAMAPPPLLFEKPRRQRGCILWLLVLALVVGIGGTVSWQFMDSSERVRLSERVADLLGGTPLDVLRAYVMPRLETRPPVPPVNESGDHGVIPEKTSAGPVVQIPIEPAAAGETQTEAAPATEDGEAEQQETPPASPPPLPEDERVRKTFINDLAGWVVKRYQPGSQGGSMAVSVQSLNQRYAASMTGLEAPGGNRASLLSYAFTPSMVRGLYHIYADSFLRALSEEARATGKGGDLPGMYRTMGSRCVLLAGGFEAVSALPDLSGRLSGLEQLGHAVTAANRKLLDDRFELAQLRDRGASRREIGDAQYRVDMAARSLHQAMDAEAAARRRFVSDIRARGASALNDESLYYLARWVGRRISENPAALEAARAAAQVLRDLSGRCAKAAREDVPGGQAQTASAAAPAQTPAPAPAVPAAGESAPGSSLRPPSLPATRVIAPPTEPRTPVAPAPRPGEASR